MIEEDDLDISRDKLSMEVGDSDFFLKFVSLEKRRVGVSISCETSLSVTRLFNCCLGGHAGS